MTDGHRADPSARPAASSRSTGQDEWCFEIRGFLNHAGCGGTGENGDRTTTRSNDLPIRSLYRRRRGARIGYPACGTDQAEKTAFVSGGLARSIHPGSFRAVRRDRPVPRSGDGRRPDILIRTYFMRTPRSLEERSGRSWAVLQQIAVHLDQRTLGGRISTSGRDGI